MRLSNVLVSLAITAIGISAAEAHGIWFAQRATQVALIYGVGSDDLDMVKRMPMISSVAGYDADYKPVATRLRAAGPLSLVDSDSPATLVTAVLENGTWTKTPDGEWHKKTKDELAGVMTEKTVKYAVMVRGPLTAPIPALPDQVLQLVPTDKTLPLVAGKPIRLQVLFKGRPVAKGEVQWDYVNDPDSKPVISGKDGMVTMKVRNQGLNVIAVTYVGPPEDPVKMDRVEYRATLSFILPHAPE